MSMHSINGIKIRTEHVYPPIPLRTMDWSAVTDDYDVGHPIGWGRTEQDAINDLMEHEQNEALEIQMREEVPVESIESVAYDTAEKPDRGYSVRASYLKAPYKGDALIEVSRDSQVIRRFLFPAYKIYNIVAHFSDIVDGELENDGRGYGAAASTGLHTPHIELEPVPPRD